MPVTTPTYGVFQGLYNGGGNTSFIGLYANGAIGHAYRVVGIAFAKDVSADTRTTTNSPTSATPYYVFQTNTRSTGLNVISATSLTELQTSQRNVVNAPVSAVFAASSQEEAKTQAHAPVGASSLSMSQESGKTLTFNLVGETYFVLSQSAGRTLTNNPTSAVIEKFAQATSKAQAGYKVQATSLIEAKTEVRTNNMPRNASESISSSTDGVKSAGKNPTSAVAETQKTTSGRSQSKNPASAVSLKQATTSKRLTAISKVAYAAGLMATVGVAARSIIRSGSAAEIQKTTSSKQQSRFEASRVAFRQTASELRSLAATKNGSSSLSQWQVAVSLIGQLFVSAPIIFQDYYDTYTNQEVNTVSYAEPSVPVFEEPNANSTFQEGDVSSFTERKWNNT